MAAQEETVTRKDTLKQVFRRMAWILLGGPASINLLGRFPDDFQLSEFLKTIILNFEKVSHAFWDMLLNFLPFHVPLDRDLITFAALLALPLAFRKYILRKHEAPFSYDSPSTQIFVNSLSGLSLTMMVVTIAISGQDAQTGVLFWVGIFFYIVASICNYIDAKSQYYRYRLISLFAGIIAISAIYTSQTDFDSETLLQKVLFWTGMVWVILAGNYTALLIPRKGLHWYYRVNDIVTFVGVPLMYVSCISTSYLSEYGYIWGFANGMLCAFLVGFTWRNLSLLPESPTYILLLSSGIILGDWIGRGIVPVLKVWLKQVLT